MLRRLVSTRTLTSTLPRYSTTTMSSPSPDAYLHLLSPSASSSESSLPSALSTLHASSRPTGKTGETRLFYTPDGKMHATVQLGNVEEGGKEEKDELVRQAVGRGVKVLREGGAKGGIEVAGGRVEEGGERGHAAGQYHAGYV